MRTLVSVTVAVVVATAVLGNRGSFAQDFTRRGGSSSALEAATRVTAVADDRTNSLVISAPQEMLPIIEALINEIDGITSSTTQFRVFPLKYADAKDMATVFTDLFRDQSSSFRSRQTASRVVAVADEYTNSVIVTAPDSIMQTIERIVKEVDTMTEDITELRVFFLRYADAEETAKVVTDIFEEQRRQTTSRDQPRVFGRGAFGFFGGGASQSNNESRSQRKVQEETVVAVADTRTNSVVARAASEIMTQIELMVKQLDANAARQKKVHVYSLKNANVEEVGAILESMFKTEGQGTNISTRGSQTGSRTGTGQTGTTSRGTSSRGGTSSPGTSGGSSNRTPTGGGGFGSLP